MTDGMESSASRPIAHLRISPILLAPSRPRSRVVLCGQIKGERMRKKRGAEEGPESQARGAGNGAVDSRHATWHTQGAGQRPLRERYPPACSLGRGSNAVNPLRGGKE